VYIVVGRRLIGAGMRASRSGPSAMPPDDHLLQSLRRVDQ